MTKRKEINFERRVEFYPAYDKRNPDPKKSYGIGSVTITFYLIADNRAVNFTLMTGWYLPGSGTGKDFEDVVGFDGPVSQVSRIGFLPADVGYHSPEPMYEGQNPLGVPCDLVKGPCHYDRSGLAAYPMFGILVKEGSDGVWRELEKRWREQFRPSEAK